MAELTKDDMLDIMNRVLDVHGVCGYGNHEQRREWKTIGQKALIRINAILKQREDKLCHAFERADEKMKQAEIYSERIEKSCEMVLADYLKKLTERDKCIDELTLKLMKRDPMPEVVVAELIKKANHIFDGIDRTHEDDGWWDSCTRAKFGFNKLEDLLVAIEDICGVKKETQDKA